MMLSDSGLLFWATLYMLSPHIQKVWDMPFVYHMIDAHGCTGLLAILYTVKTAGSTRNWLVVRL